MGEKDKIEKLLEDYPDVFADIINVLVYQGEEIVKPEELRTTNIRSQYKASDDVLHEEERDTLKEWNNKKGFKVLFGIENQTTKDKKMPLRVIAYDGASYRSQMLKKDTKEFCKVITLILHFGDNQWKDDKELREVINQESVNEELFQNYKLNVFDIAYLTEEQIKMFQSDFGIIADYFVKRRKGYKTIENHKPIKHVDEMLKFMRIFAEDERFLQLDVKKNEEGEITMCTILDTAINKGISQGITQGKIIGENAILELVKILLANNQIKDIDKIYKIIESDFIKNLKSAKEIHKETPFYTYINTKEIYNTENSENILVQGIIDLYYINQNNELILVDYKTDYTQDEGEDLVDKYKVQLEIYKKALEEALKIPVKETYIYSIYANKAINLEKR